LEEHDAVAAMQRGDINGLAGIVRAYQVKAVRTAYLIVGDRPVAEDVAQAAFLKAYRKIQQFKRGRSFEAWFMRIVVNTAIDATRKQGKQVSLDAPVPRMEDAVAFVDLLADDAHSPEEVLVNDEVKVAVQTALDQLSAEQRAAIVQRYYLDMSEAEMSDAQGAPAGTVKWRLHSARKRLRGLLAEIIGEGVL